MRSPSLAEKIAFFEVLDSLDQESSEEQDVDEEEHRAKCRAFFNARKNSVSTRKKAPSQLQRTASAPTPYTTTPDSGVVEATPSTRDLAARKALLFKGDTTSFVEETPVPDTARPSHPMLRRSATHPSSSVDQSPSASSAMRKRKRQSSAMSVPEAEQIFRGLSFYYIPNNDIAPARKLRIRKAQEFGAQWVRSLDGASHVIVDKALTYKDVQPILSSTLADAPIVVNEEYPIDCISFRTLLNPHQNRYRVPGGPLPAQEGTGQGINASPQNSDRSLQVKQPRVSRKRENTTPEATPSEGGQSFQHEARNVQQAVSDRPLPTPKPTSSCDIIARTCQPSLPEQGGKPTSNALHSPQPTSGARDELSEYIELMQQYKDLPLDLEEDDLESVKDTPEMVSDSEAEARSEDERAKRRPAGGTRRTAHKEIAFEDRFACSRGGTRDMAINAQNPNARTIEVLQSMCDYYTRINDHWRTTAYRKAITTLRRQPTKITNEEEAYRLPNIGRRLASKIEEIVSTNKLRRLEYANDEPLDHGLETFLKIYDVGTSRANKWIAQGFRTLDDLRTKADLTPNQRLGIEHYDDLNTRIPRAEVAALGEYVKREAARVDAAVELLIGGSYRRGSDSSSDIDIIVTKKGTNSVDELVPFLEELIDVLTRQGFLVATLAALHSRRTGKDGPGSKWHGCCPIWRRIDFLLVPESEYGAALIYFTGNDIFNRSMRLLASKKGMRLNQRGLYKEVMAGKERGKLKVTAGELLEGRDERRIFELLGVKWREPWERWC
ncbi:hypothetical protein N656DRAFT_710866 [Canariomyces notabilis]|uniref:DNA polymerase lambda n=1 Tax=Canariomyces notabilis TaxID=2074819 RepID=A0AAN6YQW7_9PEZI|nr:hypothetical protein N656DRAFT_710866 [Canariomyces arenarius]